MKTNEILNAERQRLEAQHDGKEDWRLWGPYLAERASLLDQRLASFARRLAKGDLVGVALNGV